MSERLTDEQLREVKDAVELTPYSRAMAAELLALRAQSQKAKGEEATAIGKLRAALKRAQHLIRNLGGQHDELLDQIEAALDKEDER